jgi:hypothetical protein
LPHRDVPGIIVERAGIVPADQQEHRQPAQAAARRLGDGRCRRARAEGPRLRDRPQPVHAGLRIESTHTIDIEKFVSRSEIDERYLDSPYYLTPEDKVGQDAFAVIREAMKRKNMVGLGRVVISRRERIVMLEPFDKGLIATTLHYA